MSYCPNCGTKLAENADACPKCGLTKQRVAQDLGEMIRHAVKTALIGIGSAFKTAGEEIERSLGEREHKLSRSKGPFCPKCGRRNPKGARFCYACGREIPNLS